MKSFLVDCFKRAKDPGKKRTIMNHRRTRRGGGWGGGRTPGLEKFQGKLCFQGNRKFLKNPE